MSNKKSALLSTILPTALVLTSIAIAVYFYQIFPEQVAIHWDINGNPNGYANRFIAAFFVPLLALVLFGIFKWLPTIDPLKKNYQKFATSYNYMIILFLVFIVALQVISGLAAVRTGVPIETLVIALIGLLFICLGFILPHVKKNWFLGIRTPWTLSSDEVWSKTHRLARYTFIFGGIILIISTLIGDTYILTALITTIVLVAIVPAIYSFFIAKK